MNRREYLRRSLQSVTLASGLLEFPQAFATFLPQNLGPLPVFADTLIPQDSTPSATQLGLHLKLVQHAKGIENYTRLLELGCLWLDVQAQAQYQMKFAGLTFAQREVVATMAEVSSRGSIQKMFFDRVLTDLMGFYYSHPASWPGLGFAAPPQPIGYPGYMEPVQDIRHG